MAKRIAGKRRLNGFRRSQAIRTDDARSVLESGQPQKGQFRGQTMSNARRHQRWKAPGARNGLSLVRHSHSTNTSSTASTGHDSLSRPVARLQPAREFVGQDPARVQSDGKI